MPSQDTKQLTNKNDDGSVATSTENKARDLLRQAALRAGQLDEGGFTRKKRAGGFKALKAEIPVRNELLRAHSRCIIGCQ